MRSDKMSSFINGAELFLKKVYHATRRQGIQQHGWVLTQPHLGAYTQRQLNEPEGLEEKDSGFSFWRVTEVGALAVSPQLTGCCAGRLFGGEHAPTPAKFMDSSQFFGFLGTSEALQWALSS